MRYLEETNQAEKIESVRRDIESQKREYQKFYTSYIELQKIFKDGLLARSLEILSQFKNGDYSEITAQAREVEGQINLILDKLKQFEEYKKENQSLTQVLRLELLKIQNLRRDGEKFVTVSSKEIEERKLWLEKEAENLENIIKRNEVPTTSSKYQTNSLAKSHRSP